MDLYTINLNSCTASILKYLLNPEIEFVWIHQHKPNPRLEWWVSDFPISPSMYMKDIEIRCPVVDIKMGIERFLSNIDLFEQHGLELFQLTKKVPDGLWIESIPEDRLNEILISNGMFSRFSLPHEDEFAQYQCISQEYVESLLEIPEIQELVL